MCRWYCESGRVGSRHFRLSGCDCRSDRTRSFFVPCREPSVSSQRSSARAPVSSPDAYHPPHRPASPAEAKPTSDRTPTTLPAKHKPPRILNTRPVACSACLLPLKHRPAANKSSRLDCVKERGISIKRQSLSRKCGNLSFGLLRLFFRVLPIFSQPTSSAFVSLLSGLPICIAAPFPRRSSKVAFPQGSSLIFLDRGAGSIVGRLCGFHSSRI